MHDTEDATGKVKQEQVEPTGGDDARAAEESGAATFRTPKYALVVEMDPDDDEEVLRDYAYGLVATAFQFAQDAESRGTEVMPSQLAEPWSQYDWDVPSKQRSPQIRECLATFSAEEIRAALSVSLGVAHTSAAGKVSLEEGDASDASGDAVGSLRFNPAIVPLAVIDASVSLLVLLAHPDGRSRLGDALESRREEEATLRQAQENRWAVDEVLRKSEENREEAEALVRYAEELAGEAEELAIKRANADRSDARTKAVPTAAIGTVALVLVILSQIFPGMPGAALVPTGVAIYGAVTLANRVFDAWWVLCGREDDQSQP